LINLKYFININIDSAVKIMNLQFSGEGNVELWLSSKLQEPWSSEKISSLLTAEMLQDIRSKFTTMETQLKLKILFAMLSMRKIALKELEAQIQELLSIGRADNDEWISVFCEMFETYPTDQTLKRDISNESFCNILHEMTVKLQHSPPQYVPLEYSYLNKKLTQLPPPLAPHFTLKRKVADEFYKTAMTKPKLLRTSELHTSQSGLNISTDGTPVKANRDEAAPSTPHPATPKFSKNMMSRSLENLSGSSGGINAERRNLHGFHKKNRMQILDINEVKEIAEEAAKKNEKKRKLHHITPATPTTPAPSTILNLGLHAADDAREPAPATTSVETDKQKKNGKNKKRLKYGSKNVKLKERRN